MDKCKLCQGDKIGILRRIKSPHVDFEYSLWECKMCGSRFFDNEEFKVSLNDIYEKMSPQRNFEVEFKPSPYWVNRKELTLKHVQSQVNSILDVGCETGTFLMHFPEVFVRDGVELSVYSVDIARKRGLKVYNDFLENIEFERVYDLVTAFAILEHLVEPHRFLSKLKDLVASNGLLVIMIPSHQCLKEKIMTLLGKKWKMYSPPEHLNFYSKAYLDGYLNSAGFVLVDRYFDSGGGFSPLRSVPIIGYIIRGIVSILDGPFFRKIAIFDHMYSVYRKN